ncbi:Ultraviolet-B receptor uvr8 [Datura stramonium]|uniref:Ultraviolet-B receptor uvr8 n=1 Tax=Datura stramonium TaxID=4076 RepID=A0ABS8VB30_DATST|nr:Ultraviolet-B receptor uvr8 [Datura stramonium]
MKSRSKICIHPSLLKPSCGITLAGNVVCSWGRGEDGQLGLGDAEDRFSPTQVSVLDGQEIVSVTCGADHTTAYSESFKQVYSWGW